MSNPPFPQMFSLQRKMGDDRKLEVRKLVIIGDGAIGKASNLIFGTFSQDSPSQVFPLPHSQI